MAWPIKFLLIVSMLIVCLQVAYRFGDRNIRPMFVMQAVGQYTVLNSLTILTTMSRDLRSNFNTIRLTILLIPIHLAYILLFAFGFTSRFGAFCGNKKIYPNVILVLNGLPFIVYILALYLYKNKFFLQWDLDSEQRQKN